MNEFISNTLLLFFILDPIALSLILPAILKNVPEERRKKVIVREMLFSLGALLLFFFLGNKLVGLLGLEVSTLTISGAIVLFLIALGMVFPTLAALTSSTPQQGEAQSEPFIVPIAVPLIVGPSSISIVMIHGAQFLDSSHNLSFVGSICAAWGLSFCIVIASRRILKILGRRGSLAMERLIGILLILLSVQMFMDGIKKYDAEQLAAPTAQSVPAK